MKGKPLSEEELVEDISKMKSLDDLLFLGKGANELIQKIGGKKEYQQMVKNFFKYSEEIVKYLQGVSKEAPEEVKKFEKLYDDVMDVAADFVGSQELKEFRSNFWELFSKLKEDKKIAPWFNETKNFLLEVIEKPDTLLSESNVSKMMDLIKRGRASFGTKKWRATIEKDVGD